MKNLMNNFSSSRLDAREMKYVIGGMNNQGQPQAGGCARKIVEQAVVSAASDELRKAVRDAGASDWFKQIKENFNRHVESQIEIEHEILKAKYPYIKPKGK